MLWRVLPRCFLRPRGYTKICRTLLDLISKVVSKINLPVPKIRPTIGVIRLRGLWLSNHGFCLAETMYILSRRLLFRHHWSKYKVTCFLVHNCFCYRITSFIFAMPWRSISLTIRKL